MWAAYNCQFDLRMLDQMSERTGIRYIKRPCIDILAMARDHVSKEDSKSHKLSAICGLLFPEDRFEYHSALEDVRACAKLMAKFVGLYRTYEEPAEKRQCHVEYASYFVNPRQKSQVRIKLKLPEGGYGDIFWDVVGKTWSCKSDKKAKELFANIDMKNIEEQVLTVMAGDTMRQIWSAGRKLGTRETRDVEKTGFCVAERSQNDRSSVLYAGLFRTGCVSGACRNLCKRRDGNL